MAFPWWRSTGHRPCSDSSGAIANAASATRTADNPTGPKSTAPWRMNTNNPLRRLRRAAGHFDAPSDDADSVALSTSPFRQASLSQAFIPITFGKLLILRVVRVAFGLQLRNRVPGYGLQK
jgi:hypothetical protein